MVNRLGHTARNRIATLVAPDRICREMELFYQQTLER